MGRKAQFFIDNDVARYALIKSSSGSSASALLLILVCFYSGERVASAFQHNNCLAVRREMVNGSFRGDILLKDKVLRGTPGAPSFCSSFAPSCYLTTTRESWVKVTQLRCQVPLARSQQINGREEGKSE